MYTMGYKIDWDDDYPVVEFAGETSFANMSAATMMLNRDERFAGSHCLLWDLSQADITSFTDNDMDQLASLDWAVSSKVKHLTKVVVVTDPSGIILFKQNIEKAKELGVPWDYHIATSIDQASGIINTLLP